MKHGFIASVIITALALIGCNNFFHELIPPDENRIISFSVDGQIGNTEIYDYEIRAIIDNETTLHSLIPNIEISNKATIIPLTLNYLVEAFPSANILQEAAGIYGAQDLKNYVMDLLERNQDCKLPVIDKPIDFSGPVTFIVISGQGSMRQYTVNVIKDNGQPCILNFGFSKYFNPELIKDAVIEINERAKTVHADITYPAEMTLSYELIPSFVILGDRIEADGAEIRSGIDAIKFYQSLGSQAKTITVWRNEISLDYTIDALFSEDNNSIRDITDFRFYKNDNPSIAETAVGSIVNSGALGTITVQVFYSGAKPSVLKPSFYSPGNVTVNGSPQVSGGNSHDFSSVVEYLIISRNNMYARTYSVVVEFIDVATAMPAFTSFRFSSTINSELVQDTIGQITDSAGVIMITARYGGSTAPKLLIPEFEASGIVTVLGAVQTSSFSAQNFSTQIRYTVTHPNNPMLSRDYWVQTSFTRDTSSDAAITSFSFHPNENHGLLEELQGQIENSTGKITIYAPVGSGVTARTMFPRYTAAGQVRVDGDIQESGIIGRMFDKPVVYEVISANGVNRRQYTVTVRELQTTIYVKADALGLGDGSSWSDAFRNLNDACEAAALFPEDIPREIWIAAGTYKPSITGDSEKYFLLAPNTSYLGGFAGNETSKNSRNPSAYKVTISGDLGGGRYSNNLFGNFNRNSIVNINSNVYFDGLAFVSAKSASASSERRYGSAICVSLATVMDCLKVVDCTFNNLEAYNGGAIYARGGIVDITAITIENSTAESGGAIYLTGNGNALLESVNIKNCNATTSGGGIYSAMPITASGLTIDNTRAPSGAGIYSTRDTNISNSRIQNIPATNNVVYISAPTVQVTDTSLSYITMTANGDNSALYVSSYGNNGSVTINKVSIYGITNGRGIYVSSYNNLLIMDSTIESCSTTGNGAGIYIINRASAEFSSLTIRNSTAEGDDSYGGGVYYYGYNDGTYNSRLRATVTLNDVISRGSVGGMYLWGDNIEVINSTFINVTARYDYKILFHRDTTRFLNCTFTHNNYLSNPGSRGSRRQDGLFMHTGIFENCTFNNLKSNASGQNYLFEAWSEKPEYILGIPIAGGTVWTGTNLTLRNCTFNMNYSLPIPYRGIYSVVGICALFEGRLSDNSYGYNRLLMDGCRINATFPDSQDDMDGYVIFWFYRSYFGINQNYNFQFRRNNYYNGRMITTASGWYGITTTIPGDGYHTSERIYAHFRTSNDAGITMID